MSSNKPPSAFELHQYVVYDSPDAKRKRIVLDDYAPPQSLSVHLSKIDMPELQPKPSQVGAQRERAGSGSWKEDKKDRWMDKREDKKGRDKGKEKEKEDKKWKGKERDKSRGDFTFL